MVTDTIAGLSTGGDGNPVVDETKYEVANIPCILDCEEAKHEAQFQADLTQAKLRVCIRFKYFMGNFTFLALYALQ